MDITISPSKLNGKIRIIPSKSQAHRLLICAALSDKETILICPYTNQDITATVNCLNALGAKIIRTTSGYTVNPIQTTPVSAVLNCGESGSTLRFLLPIAGALGVDTTFIMTGRLPARPLTPLWEEMERMGCHLARPTTNTIRCTGKLRRGTYTIDGSVSSQFITGLLFAATLLDGDSDIQIIGHLESAPYVHLTQQALATFQINTDHYHIVGKQQYRSPGHVVVEGDWSNGAFFLAANALGSQLQIENLDPASTQGDRAAADIIAALERNISVSAQDIPDLVPILAVVACCKQGATFTNIQRLRLKESDRVESVAAMLRALGAKIETTDHTIQVFPTMLHGGVIDTAGDHRIAMAAAIAATAADGPVRIQGSECVAKSYPIFWDEYRRLGGIYE